MGDHQYFTVGDIVGWSDSKDPLIENTIASLKKDLGDGLFRIIEIGPSGDTRIEGHPQRLKIRSINDTVVAFKPAKTHGTGTSWFLGYLFKKHVETGD